MAFFGKRLAATTAIVGFAFLAGSGLAQTPQRGGTAVFVLTQDPPDVNPDTTSGIHNRMVGCTIHQGLIRVSEDFRILPNLATAWAVTPDGLTYSFDLRPVQFHDGQPMTSEDVKYTLTEVSAKFSAVFTAAGQAIDSVEAPAKDKVVIKLKKPFGPFLSSLACEQGAAILPAHIFRGTSPRENPASSDKATGTGAFKMAEWKRGDRVRMVKNDKYWDAGKPYLDEVIGRIINQSNAAMLALQAGEVDVYQVAPVDALAKVKADAKLKVETSDVPPVTTYAFLNTKHKPLDDKRVRQALYMATDRDYLLKNAFFEVGSVPTNPYTTAIGWASNPDVDYRKMYPFDVAKANALLDAAGLKRGADGKRFPLRLVTFANDYPEFVQVSVALKSMWQAIGVDVTVESLETATVNKRVYIDGDFDVNLQVYNSFADPAFGISRVFVSSSIGRQAGNGSFYSNPDVDKLFDQAAGVTSIEERGKFYRQAISILAEEMPVLTLRQSKYIDYATKRLHDLWGQAQGEGDWSSAWLEK